MPSNIDLLAHEGSSLSTALEEALDVLRMRAIPIIGAAQIFETDSEAPGWARILLRDPSDRPRAVEILVGVASTLID